MATAVIDLLQPESNTLGVASAWIECGVARPVAWIQVRGAATWQLLDPDPDRPSDLTEMGEILNYLGGREGLHVVVLGDHTSAGDGAILDSLVSLLDRIARDFGPRRPPMHLMLAVPGNRPADVIGRFPVPLVELRSWDGVLLVSPEDSPDPGLGNELGERPMDSLVAHSLFGLCNGWRVNAKDPPERTAALDSDKARGRMVRSWSRIVDAGFVIDQLAEEVMRLPASSLDPVEKRIDGVLQEILRSDVVAADLETKPPTPPEAPQRGLRYLIEFIKFAVRRAIPVAFGLLKAWVMRWIVGTIQRAVKWAFALIGLGKRESLQPLEPVDAGHTLSDPVSRARETLRVLAAGGDVSEPPSSNAVVLEAITGGVIASIDDGRLSIVEAVGTDTGRVPSTLMGRLIAEYNSPVQRSLGQVEAVIARLQEAIGKAEPSPDAEEADPVGSPSDPPTDDEEERRRLAEARRQRVWRWIKRGFRLLAVMVVLGALVVGLVVPALAFLLFLPAAVAVVIVTRTAVRFLRHLGRLFEEERHGLSPVEFYEAQLEYLVRLCVNRTYRVAQLQRWTRVMRAAAEGVAAGPELPVLEQRPFTPVYAPRSMVIATGVADRSELVLLARRVRASTKAQGIYRNVWSAVLSDRRDAFLDRRRHPSDGPMAELLDMDIKGLPADVREIGRKAMVSVLRDITPSLVLKGVVPWVRQREPHGVERTDAKPGVEPPGPSGRAVSVSTTELGLHAIDDAVVAVGTATSGFVGLGVVLAGEGRLVVTARTLVEGTTDVLVNGSSVGAIVPDDLLVAIHHEPDLDGVPLGGLATVRLGRPVLAPVVDSGDIIPRRATIATVSDDGFSLDIRPPLGTPVIDAATGALLGVVVDATNGRAVGPVGLQRLLASVAGAAVDRSEEELDVGLWIPFDVRIGGPGVQADVPVADEVRPVDLTAEEFLGRLSAPAEWFLPLLTDDSMKLKVDPRSEWLAPDDPGHSTLAAWLAPEDPGQSKIAGWLERDGRLLFAAHRIQMSEEFPLPDIYDTWQSEGGPRQRGVGL